MDEPRLYDVQLHWGVRIPLRDGARLNATLYLPRSASPAPVIFTLTPYVAQRWHGPAQYFAARGFPFLAVDARGRGDSEGVFKPNINEAADGCDTVGWLAQQPYCDGQVAMWGGSYAGYGQWATARELPPRLATIVPAAAPYFGVDFPMRGNIPAPYLVRWLTLVAGRTAQDEIFADLAFWRRKFLQWFEGGVPFRELDALAGGRSEVFREWLAHPHRDSYWDGYNPRPEQYARIKIPVLTITGACDGNQPGALMHYREHLRNAVGTANPVHYLILGPWDHAGTRIPKQEFCGLKLGVASLVDLLQLHLQWYTWTMRGGVKPEFLRKPVAYYVLGAEQWRYADTIDAITSHTHALYLQSGGAANDVFSSGSLSPTSVRGTAAPDMYVYDPRDMSLAAIESTVDPADRTDQRMVLASGGRHLVYHSAPFATPIEVCGFFKLSLWLAIDQPDTDFRAAVYEIDAVGGSVLLSVAVMRARHRRSLYESELIRTQEPQRYDFQAFAFVAKRLARASRLRLVIGPVNSIYSQKNYNSGGVCSDESVHDARVVRVELFHDERHPSVLHIPIGNPED